MAGADALEAPPATLFPPYAELLRLAYELEAPPTIPRLLLDDARSEVPLDPPLLLVLLPEAMPLLDQPPPPEGEPPAAPLSDEAELHAPTSKGAVHKAQHQARTRCAAVERP